MFSDYIGVYSPKMARSKNDLLSVDLFCDVLASLIPRSDVGASGKPFSILVALSGGPDSVALLHLIHAAGQRMRFAVEAAHLNYKLRGEDSDQDEQFCRKVCRELGIKLHVQLTDLTMRKRGSNLQAEARRVRYDYFEKIRSRHKSMLITIAHNKTDNVETILMNLARGAGTFGLSGIEPVSGYVIRPLLDFSREDILGYLQKHHFPYRVDRSNLEDKYTRNKVRQQLLPAFTKIFGGAALDNINRAGQIISAQEDFLRGYVVKQLERDITTTPFGKIALDLKRFSGYDDFVKRLAVVYCFERLTGSMREFDSAAAERVVGLSDGEGQVDLKSKVIAEVAGRRLYLYRKDSGSESYRVSRTGTTKLQRFGLDLTITTNLASAPSRKTVRSGNNFTIFLNQDRLRGKLSIRSVKAGDRFRPLGMNGSKKLSDFFVDRHIDRPLREEIPLLLCGDKIVWIIGHEIADEFKIADRTTAAVKLEVTPYRER